jgi:ATP-dependent Clp protease, protease subunit
MNIIYTPSPLLKEVKFRSENLPVVVRVNKFDEKAAEDFSRSVARAQNTGQPVLPIIIDSYGGQVYSLMSMISDIQHSRLPVATIVQGKAMSC